MIKAEKNQEGISRYFINGDEDLKVVSFNRFHLLQVTE